MTTRVIHGVTKEGHGGWQVHAAERRFTFVQCHNCAAFDRWTCVNGARYVRGSSFDVFTPLDKTIANRSAPPWSPMDTRGMSDMSHRDFLDNRTLAPGHRPTHTASGATFVGTVNDVSSAVFRFVCRCFSSNTTTLVLKTTDEAHSRTSSTTTSPVASCCSCV